MNNKNIYNEEDTTIFLKSISNVYNSIASQSTWISNIWSPDDISAEQLLAMNKLFLDMISETRVSLGYFYDCETSEAPYSYGNPKIEIQAKNIPFTPRKTTKKTSSSPEINTDKSSEQNTPIEKNTPIKKFSNSNSQEYNEPQPEGVLIGQQYVDF